MKEHIITISVIILGSIALAAYLFSQHYDKTSEPENIYGRECPVCPPCEITAKSIKQRAVDYSGKRFKNATKFILPDNGDLEIKIGKNVYTKKELETLKK